MERFEGGHKDIAYEKPNSFPKDMDFKEVL